MPTGKNWFQFIYVNFCFAMFIVLIYYYVSIKEIKEKWPLYRCNPIYMPLADIFKRTFSFVFKPHSLILWDTYYNLLLLLQAELQMH